VLSILKPEITSLLLALGALTISTAATLQFPNILSAASSGPNIAADLTNDVIVDNYLIPDIGADGSSNPTSTTTTTQHIIEQQQQKLDQTSPYL
jgi:hypothetical protein